MTIGILNIQGAIVEHKEVCERNGIKVKLVNKADDFQNINALILPGGESTVMRRLIDKDVKLKNSLEEFCSNKPVYATCAGSILLSNEYLKILDINVNRNGFGSQIASEVAKINWNDITQEVAFIRAPILEKIGDTSFNTEVYHRDQLVGLETNNIIALSFHPELTSNDELFKYFLKKCLMYVNTQ